MTVQWERVEPGWYVAKNRDGAELGIGICREQDGLWYVYHSGRNLLLERALKFRTLKDAMLSVKAMRRAALSVGVEP